MREPGTSRRCSLLCSSRRNDAAAINWAEFRREWRHLLSVRWCTPFAPHLRGAPAAPPQSPRPFDIGSHPTRPQAPPDTAVCPSQQRASQNVDSGELPAITAACPSSLGHPSAGGPGSGTAHGAKSGRRRAASGGGAGARRRRSCPASPITRCTRPLPSNSLLRAVAAQALHNHTPRWEASQQAGTRPAEPAARPKVRLGASGCWQRGSLAERAVGASRGHTAGGAARRQPAPAMCTRSAGLTPAAPTNRPQCDASSSRAPALCSRSSTAGFEDYEEPRSPRAQPKSAASPFSEQRRLRYGRAGWERCWPSTRPTLLPLASRLQTDLIRPLPLWTLCSGDLDAPGSPGGPPSLRRVSAPAVHGSAAVQRYLSRGSSGGSGAGGCPPSPRVSTPRSGAGALRCIAVLLRRNTCMLELRRGRLF